MITDPTAVFSNYEHNLLFDFGLFGLYLFSFVLYINLQMFNFFFLKI